MTLQPMLILHYTKLFDWKILAKNGITLHHVHSFAVPDSFQKS